MIIIQEFNYNNNYIKLETGLIARKASSSVLISYNNNTKILITISENNKNNVFKSFLKLTVNYYERSYSYGKFPNNIFKREIRQTENEILISRLIDRSVRPLFDKDKYNNEIQITVIVLSLDKDINPDIISIIGVSAALSLLKNKYYNGVLSASRVSYINNTYIINPNISVYKNNLNLLISRNNNSIVMIESFSNEISEKKLLEAIKFGYDNQNIIINNINIFTEKASNSILNNYVNEIIDYDFVYKIIYDICFDNLYNIFLIKNKHLRDIEIDNIKKDLLNKISSISDISNDIIENNFNKLLKYIFRIYIINNNIRLDNRKFNEIRNININLNILPNAHGSALFTRGNTQSLAIITFGIDKQNNIDEKVLFHYNFLNYCFNEIGNLSFPKRREIGHARLAKKSILPLINIENFPFSIRIVSEITESDGSSSMASVCSSSLALMSSGSPLKSNIAGIAMGIIFIDKDKYIILTDITGEEDNFGDVDIKISGTKNGITALQMDVKVDKYIDINVLNNVICNSKEALLNIIVIMDSNISIPNKLSNNCPVYYSFNISSNKIKDLIGKGGVTIKKIIDDTSSTIDIDNNGKIQILSPDNNLLNLTLNKIKNILFMPKLGAIYIGKIINIYNLNIKIYIKDINKNGFYINKSNKLLKIGQVVTIKIINIINNKIKLNLI